MLRYIMMFNERNKMAILFSTLMTGFGQIYNRQYLKALLFFIPAFLANIYGNINDAIAHSFTGEFSRAQAEIENLNEWVLFYPCWYIGSMCDAYFVAYELEHSTPPPTLDTFPFVLTAMGGTIGVIIGRKFVPGPILIGIGLMIVGAIIGYWLRKKALEKYW